MKKGKTFGQLSLSCLLVYMAMHKMWSCWRHSWISKASNVEILRHCNP